MGISRGGAPGNAPVRESPSLSACRSFSTSFSIQSSLPRSPFFKCVSNATELGGSEGDRSCDDPRPSQMALRLIELFYKFDSNFSSQSLRDRYDFCYLDEETTSQNRKQQSGDLMTVR